jgi:transposase
MSQRRGSYVPEFRQQMVELAKAGRNMRELAMKLVCHESSVSAWVRQAKAGEMGGAGLMRP